MKTITIALFVVLLSGCSKSDETVSIGSKENRDKGLAVIAEHQRALLESDRKLFEAEEKSQKKSPAPPGK